MNKFDAIFIATGTHICNKLKLGEEKLNGVYCGLSFLKLTKYGSPPSIGKVTVVIGGGYGLMCKENFDKIFKLAKNINGQVGGTRRPIMDGWMPEHLQIGISGVTIFPDLYLSFGISGAIQHIVGITKSKTIVAINTDPNAPIFKTADYCIIDDAPKILEGLLKYYRG